MCKERAEFWDLCNATLQKYKKNATILKEIGDHSNIIREINLTRANLLFMETIATKLGTNSNHSIKSSVILLHLYLFFKKQKENWQILHLK